MTLAEIQRAAVRWTLPYLILPIVLETEDGPVPVLGRGRQIGTDPVHGPVVHLFEVMPWSTN